MSDPVRVTVTVTLDVDPDAWSQNYGVEGRAAFRDDVKTYVRNLAAEQLAEVDVLAAPRTYGVRRIDGTVRDLGDRVGAARRFVRDIPAHALQYRRELLVSFDGGQTWEAHA